MWIIYLQTGHEAEPALEVNAYLVFKAYLSMEIHILVYTFFTTQFCGLRGGFGSRTFAIVYFKLRKCAKKAAVTGMGLTLLDLKNSIDSKKKTY